MNTLYLHIGTNKTGSSALQNFFYQNSEYLKRMGLLYPVGGASLGGKYNYAAGNACGLVWLQGEEVYRKHLELCTNAIRTSSDVLLSSEGYWFTPNKEEYFKQLKKLPFQIKVIVYLRRQDQYLSATINQRIKNDGHFITRYPKCLCEGNNSNITLNYFESLEKFPVSSAGKTLSYVGIQRILL